MNGILVSGHQVRIENMSYFNDSTLIKLQFSEEFGSIIIQDIANDTHLSSFPLERDPYESKFVDINASNIPKAGQGVILKKSVLSGTIVAYFNGVNFDKKNVFSWNPFKKRSVFLIDFEDDDGKEIFLDIPEKFTNSSKYNATSGHKVNKRCIV